MVSASLLLSLLLRVLGVGLSLYLLYQVRDRRFLFLVGMLSFMALRQFFALLGVDPFVAEIPGFVVSLLAVGLVFYLHRYVEQESETQARLRETNERLRTNRNRLRAAMEASPDYIFLFDEAKRYREILSGEDDLTIRPPEEFIESEVGDVLPDEAAAAVRKALDATLETGESQRIEYSLPREDGVEWYEGRTARVRYPGDQPPRVLFVARDVTDRREREQELRRFRRAIETAGQAIYITDPDGEITYANPAFEAVTGYAREEALGETPHILDSGQMSEEYFGDLWETILDGEVWEEEIVNERKDGTRYHAQQTIAPITDDSGSISEFVAIQTDITPLKERERQLHVLSRVLRHNLRNDMNVILGKAREIEATAGRDIAEDAAQIEQTGETLLELAETYREILELVEPAVSRRRIQLCERLRLVVQDVREAHPEADLDVEFECADEVSVIAIPGVERAVDELLENAVVHSDRETPEVRLRVESTPDRVRIRVADDGPGIPPTEWEILTGEHEIDALSHGSGLGLWLVYWLVTRSGGHLSFEENDPRGSVVTIELKRDRPRETPPRRRPRI